MTCFASPQKDFGGTGIQPRRFARVDRALATVWYDRQEGLEALDLARRMPMTGKGNDPFALWQQMLGEMEKGFNAFANQAMSSPEFSKAMNQAGGASAGAQKQFGELMERYLLNMNLPSRAQMVGIAERLQSIESQLNEITTMLRQMNANAGGASGYAGAPRPPRTKRPPAPSVAPPSGEQK